MAKAFRKIGCPAVITGDREEIRRARSIVVPGVGAFGRCMENLARSGLDTVIRDAVDGEKPYLGICLGYQILFDGSEEDGGVPGLGVIEGVVKRFSPALKVPHMGWNTIRFEKIDPVLDGIRDGSYLYFVHSYYPVPVSYEVVAATTDYGVHFASAVRMGGIFATQFHPEKSQSVGLEILRNFCAYVEDQC